MAQRVFPDDPRTYLEREYDARRARRPHYSLRAYARDLDLSPTSLTDFLKARQGFSPERAVSVAKKLRLDSEQTKHFRDLISVRYARKKSDRAAAAMSVKARTRPAPAHVSLDLYKIVADWPHFAALELLEIDAKYADPVQLALALKISKKEARETWERLLRTKLVIRQGDAWMPNSEHSFAGDEQPSEAVRFHHARLLKKAAAALEQQPIEEREFQSMVFSFKREDLGRLRSELTKAFIDVLGKYSAEDPRDAVYCASFQLFNLVPSPLPEGES